MKRSEQYNREDREAEQACADAHSAAMICAATVKGKQLSPSVRGWLIEAAEKLREAGGL